MKQISKFILTAFILFEANSLHIGNNYDYNSDHRLTGIGINHDNYSIAIATFKNSYYRQSRTLKGKYTFGNFGLIWAFLDGYHDKVEFIAYPVMIVDYMNIGFEFSFLPGKDPEAANLIMITKQVNF